jgi:hypothetical protein
MAGLFEGLEICIIGDCIGQKRLQVLQSNVSKGGGKLISKELVLEALTCSDDQKSQRQNPVQVVTVLPLERVLSILSPRNSDRLSSLSCPRCGQIHVCIQNDSFISNAVGQRRKPKKEELFPPTPCNSNRSHTDAISTNCSTKMSARSDSMASEHGKALGALEDFGPEHADEEELQWARVGNKRVLDQLNELSDHFKARFRPSHHSIFEHSARFPFAFS